MNNQIFMPLLVGFALIFFMIIFNTFHYIYCLDRLRFEVKKYNKKIKISTFTNPLDINRAYEVTHAFSKKGMKNNINLFLTFGSRKFISNTFLKNYMELDKVKSIKGKKTKLRFNKLVHSISTLSRLIIIESIIFFLMIISIILIP